LAQFEFSRPHKPSDSSAALLLGPQYPQCKSQNLGSIFHTCIAFDAREVEVTDSNPTCARRCACRCGTTYMIPFITMMEQSTTVKPIAGCVTSSAAKLTAAIVPHSCPLHKSRDRLRVRGKMQLYYLLVQNHWYCCCKAVTVVLNYHVTQLHSCRHAPAVYLAFATISLTKELAGNRTTSVSSGDLLGAFDAPMVSYRRRGL
jgi:hypothetical protein